MDFKKGLQLVRDLNAFVCELYGDLVLCLVGHMEEYTAHVHSWIVPLEEKDVRPVGRPPAGTKATDRVAEKKWVLAARTMFTPARCSKVQTLLANFLCGRGWDVEPGIKGARSSHMKMAGHMKLVHGPVPPVPPISLPPPPTPGAATPVNPQAYCRQIFDAATSWHQEITETVIPPLYAKALEYDGADYRCRMYQRTAQDKEKEIQHYHEDLGLLMKDLSAARTKVGAQDLEIKALRGVPLLEEVAARLIGRGHVQSVVGAVTTFRLPDAMALEIDSQTQSYRRQISGPPASNTIDSVTGSGVLNMVMDVAGWDVVRSLGWIERQWGPRLLAPCLAERTNNPAMPMSEPGSEPSPVAPPFSVLRPQLEKRSKKGWSVLYKVLVHDYRFSPDLVDELYQSGELDANRFGDLLLFSPDPTGTNGPQVYPLIQGVITRDSSVTGPKPFRLGSGSTHLLVVEGLLDTLALWQSIPEELRTTVTVAAISNEPAPSLWASLQKDFPDARLFNAFASAHKAVSPVNRQIAFPATTALSPTPFKSWLGAWYGQYENEAGAAQFRDMQRQLADVLTPEMPMDGP
jgi:hypothetical protein